MVPELCGASASGIFGAKSCRSGTRRSGSIGRVSRKSFLKKDYGVLRRWSLDYPLRRRWMQIKSLHQVNAEILHRLVLFGGLHSFRNHHRILVVAESNHFLDETLLDEILVDA